MMKKLLVDFNGLDGNRVSGLETDANENVGVGDHVLLFDGDNEAWATVTAVDDGLVRTEMDWSTWGEAEQSLETLEIKSDIVMLSTKCANGNIAKSFVTSSLAFVVPADNDAGDHAYSREAPQMPLHASCA